MKNNVSTLFYLKKPKNYVSGEMPIYLRITVDGIRKDFTSGKSCEPAKWNAKANRMTGTTPPVKAFNYYLFNLEKQIDQIHTDLFNEGKTITAETIKNKYFGVEVVEIPHNLVVAFQDHNDKVEALIGKDFAKGTLTKYNATLKHVKSFLKAKYRVEDLLASKVDYRFITEFDFYLRTCCGCANNAAVKHLKNLGKIIRICLANRWITFDPFLNHRNKIKKVKRVVLTQSELVLLQQKEFKIERLRIVRDAFLFCCYTGLSFIDVRELTKSEIRQGENGEAWIIKNRHKTDVASHVPLLPIAEEILNRYAEHPQVEDSDRVLPIASNQKMNAYLKEVADLCGIDKHLTFHIARHTFATTVTLNNGVPIESVSKMLGHTDIRTTQIYAKMLDEKVGTDMTELKAKFSA
jgi:site-specific recombinase XerD